jgi:hypothetical protein
MELHLHYYERVSCGSNTGTPSYHVEYAENGANFKWKLIQNGPKMIRAIQQEKKIIQDWVEKYAIGIISDNRLGVLSKKSHLFLSHTN